MRAGGRERECRSDSLDVDQRHYLPAEYNVALTAGEVLRVVFVIHGRDATATQRTLTLVAQFGIVCVYLGMVSRAATHQKGNQVRFAGASSSFIERVAHH